MPLTFMHSGTPSGIEKIGTKVLGFLHTHTYREEV